MVPVSTPRMANLLRLIFDSSSSRGCQIHKHILLAFRRQSDVKTSEPSLSINRSAISSFGVCNGHQRTLARGELQCESQKS
jgi:hypothetical protein